MKIKGLSAKHLRILLVAVITLTLIATAAGFIFMLQQLKTFAVETNTLSQESTTSSKTLSQLKELDRYLSSHSEDIERAADITSSTEAYSYQDDFVKELARLGKQSGVDVTNFDFSASEGGGTEGAAPAPTTAAPATPAVPGADGGTVASPGAASIKSIACTVTVKSPMPYKKLLTFLKLVEANPKRMQVTSVSIGTSKGDTSGSSEQSTEASSGSSRVKNGSVTVQPLKILVYLRQ